MKITNTPIMPKVEFTKTINLTEREAMLIQLVIGKTCSHNRRAQGLTYDQDADVAIIYRDLVQINGGTPNL